MYYLIKSNYYAGTTISTISDKDIDKELKLGTIVEIITGFKNGAYKEGDCFLLREEEIIDRGEDINKLREIAYLNLL